MDHEKSYSIGEIANLTGVTIRTLQYYDNIGLVPLKKHPNGRRYFTNRDLTKLQQVLFYKSLGLSIKDIKRFVVDVVESEQISLVLEKQRDMLYQKLNDIKTSISFIEASLISLEKKGSFPLEIIRLIISLNKDTVFKYKDVSHEQKVKQVITKHYDSDGKILDIYWDWKSFVLEAASLILNGVDPQSEQGQKFAGKWNKLIQRMTSGNQELLEAFKSSYDNRDLWPEEDRRLMEFADDFIDRATKIYLSGLNKESSDLND